MKLLIATNDEENEDEEDKQVKDLMKFSNKWLLVVFCVAAEVLTCECLLCIKSVKLQEGQQQQVQHVLAQLSTKALHVVALSLLLFLQKIFSANAIKRSEIRERAKWKPNLFML